MRSLRATSVKLLQLFATYQGITEPRTAITNRFEISAPWKGPMSCEPPIPHHSALSLSSKDTCLEPDLVPRTESHMRYRNPPQEQVGPPSFLPRCLASNSASMYVTFFVACNRVLWIPSHLSNAYTIPPKSSLSPLCSISAAYTLQLQISQLRALYHQPIVVTSGIR